MLIDDFTGNTPPIAEKNTKAEITKAYQTLLKKYEEKVREKKIDAVKKNADEQVIHKATEYTVDAILNQMDNIKRTIETALAELARSLTKEQKRLEEIQQAIKIQEQRLKELHDIEASALNLEELIRAQEIKKETFDEEYEKMKVARRREEEEYHYVLSQQRKKEEFARQEREETLKKREEEIRAQENDTKELRKRADQFPAELQQTLEKARREGAEEARKELQMKAELMAMEVEGEKKVLLTRITFLDQILAKQKEEVISLKHDLEDATRQVRFIAEKAIESSAGKQTLKAISEIALHQTGRQKNEEKE